MRGVTKHSSLKGWLGSKAPGSGGSQSSYLTGWKKKPGYVDTFMHSKTLPMSVWRHGIPIFVIVKDKDTKEEIIHVWNRKHTCHETEEILEAQYWRTTKGDPSSPRKHPPERCGLCKFNEWAWQECWAWLETHDWDEEAGAWKEKKKTKSRGTDPCAVVFRLISEADDKENTTIHLGGMCGLFGRRELPDDLVKAMRKAKVSPKEAWKENWSVKPSSVMCVVDNDNPGEGVRISEESKELGEKVKEEITRVYEGAEVDIQRSPYCIRWKYHEGAQLGKMYTATAMMKIKPSPRILKLLRGEAPDLSHITDPFDQLDLRSYLEKNCKLKDVPWDDFFPDEDQVKAWKKEDDAAAAEEEGEEPEAEEDEETSEDEDDDSDDDDDAEKDDKDTDSDDEEDEDDDMVACDDCSKPMKADATKCPHCGKKYDVEKEETEEEEEPEPPKKLKTRSELAAEKAAAAKKKSSSNGEKSTTSKKASAGKEKPAREPGDDTEEDDNQDDEIPF